MKDQNNSFKKNSFLESIIKSRKGKVNLKYFSPIQIHRNKNNKGNIIVNKINIKELSKFSDRPIQVNKQKKKQSLKSNSRYISEDKIYLNTDNNYSSNNEKQKLLNSNSKTKKNIVIFTECPKKISDYILKNNNKKKLYQLTYLGEEDLNDLNNKIYPNYNSNRDYNPRLIKKQKNFNLNTYDDHYLLKEMTNNHYNTIDKSKKRMRNDYSSKTIYSNNQNKDVLKVIKIQSVWRGYQIRRFIVKSLNNFYNLMKMFNSLYLLCYDNFKPIFKRFLNLLVKRKKTIIYNNKNKTYINKDQFSGIKRINSNINIPKKRYTKENNVINKSSKDNTNKFSRDNINKISKVNPKKFTVIEKKNINVFIPGEIKTKQANKNFVYKKKKNSHKNSPSLVGKRLKINKNNNIRENNNTRENNFKAKNKKRIFEGFKNVNYKNKLRIEIYNIVNYVIKKNIFLYSPLFLYRLRILEKMKIIEYKYKCLFNLIKIKEKLCLYPYFKKYRKNIFSQTINQIYSKKEKNINNNDLNDLNKRKFNDDQIIKNDNINNITNAKNEIMNSENKEKTNNIINNITNKNTIKNNIIDKKMILLNKIFNKKESKINKLLIINIFNKWKDFSKNIFVLPQLRLKKNKVIQNLYKNPEGQKKKFIKVRKLKSEQSKYFSQLKSTNSGKLSIHSFESDNINVKKMKITKVNVLTDSKEIKNSITKEFNFNNKVSAILDNFYFIKKIADISVKISNKNNIYKCFSFWKKRTKENK